ncbi:peroxyureidoacrylate/ureidoacrylate amidohydrolase RutB [Leminorella grimontii]|uniref:Peroxyureidoacrylate/ureidoacrylate amidohydrolase RutB n=1 Tax=Leminorella grimontii TaxID=82981 RepID=A0AAV5MZE3_9GAMM|nr:cysteine hydrolase [Leminorella grimontii]KFC96514.1 isochorismatase [Leminorella grimontii ATCC 33999 = DSM 5078]GKX54289.1 peroxyureidoacrylate/ureidoacrylate amidohydrolase RutB [Leminorella grimontii]GKX57729.1 peroxyureidoacrylate/ureidoacrylate amidohydrolase RutB [Leminorella grimontii]VFS59593.1 Isochorismatase family protein yecD [Leminorella grimontii]
MSSALIVIDLIEEIIGERGRSNGSAGQTKDRNVVAKTNLAVAAARAKSIPIVWVKVGFADDYSDIPPYSPMFNAAKQNGALRLSDPGCDWVEGLDVQPQDEVVVKKAVSAFAGNALLSWLTDRGYDHVLLAGVSSAMAIQNTARQAHDLGFRVTVLEDLCAAATADLHQQSMDMLRPMAEITTSDVFFKS